ncbi:unnamed protein product [Acanthosepion pharaonis]|uniref:LisH domain-containing protein n=1 Tax=Acanthosepion pharaonis TaxID=158019 RepID=A0A812B054_ACAPH|nr:unnamed protein product [Sepia pharaonis]
MYAKGKGSTVPSDAQAREKLALYVYEYLLHVGAQKSAQTFLSEGFVNSGVNGIAYNAAAPSPLGQMPPQDGMPGGPMPGFFTPPASQPSPHPQPHTPMMGQNQKKLVPPLSFSSSHTFTHFHINYSSASPGSYNFPPMGGPDGGMPMGPDMPAVMNGEMDGMKSSPPNGPGTPRENLPPDSTGEIGGYSLGYQENILIEGKLILSLKVLFFCTSFFLLFLLIVLLSQIFSWMMMMIGNLSLFFFLFFSSLFLSLSLFLCLSVCLR